MIFFQILANKSLIFHCACCRMTKVNLSILMHRRIFTLVAACLLPVASISLAQDKIIPQNADKEEARLSVSILDSATALMKSDALADLTPEKKIRRVFDSLVKSYGVKNRLEIAKALSTLVPEDLHGYVAKRALAYSPVKAKELLASLSNSGSVSSALSSLPTNSVHTAGAADAVGVKLDQPSRVFQLPQVDARRRVLSRDEDGRIIQAEGSFDPDGGGPDPAITVTITLGSVQDNGFTSDGMAYTVVNKDTGDLIGNYLALEEEAGDVVELFLKNVAPGDPTPGTGDLEMITVTSVE